MNPFIAYIEETLHIGMDASPYGYASSLPLYLKNSYELYTLTVWNVRCLLAKPKEPSNLTVLRKQCVQLKKFTGLDCVLCLKGVRAYTKEKMLSEGIPFIIIGQQIYMPFLGVALSQNGIREIPHTEQLSFVTQKLLLTAIYRSWTKTTLTEAAKLLEVSKMTITRSFDEIQSLGFSCIHTEGKMRRFLWENSRLALWDMVRPKLRNPARRQYRFGELYKIESAKLGGISAISHYSMLADSPFTVYAVIKADIKKMGLNELPLIPEKESPAMVVQVMPYDIWYGDNLAVDPLTAILSLTDDELKDPRVEAAIEEILEACLHD
jgi:hypothetical protein